MDFSKLSLVNGMPVTSDDVKMFKYLYSGYPVCGDFTAFAEGSGTKYSFGADEYVIGK